MKHWADHGPIMRVSDFKWAKKAAWASQTIKKNGKYWFYAAVEHDGPQPSKAIAVAVSDTPTGRFGLQGFGAHHQPDDAQGHV